MTTPIPQAIRGARRSAGALLLLTSTATAVGLVAAAYAVATQPPVVGPLVPAPGSAAPAPVAVMPGEFSGRWAGDVDQVNADTWTAELHLHGGGVNSVIGESAYPTLGCSGTLTLVRVERDRIDVLETITRQADDGRCLEQVDITLVGASDGVVEYRNSDGSRHQFRGELTRR